MYRCFAYLVAVSLASLGDSLSPKLPAILPSDTSSPIIHQTYGTECISRPDTVPLQLPGMASLPVPETLVFDIIWGGWSFRWVHAGQASMTLSQDTESDRLRIRTRAWSNRFFTRLYPVSDTIDSWIDPQGMYPVRFHKRTHNGNYHKSYQVVFDQQRRRVCLQDTVLNTQPFTRDILAAFYYIRTQKLEVGKTFDLAAVSGKKQYNLRVFCHKKETVEVPAGRFQTVKVEPVLQDDGLFKAKGKMWIWLTDDQRRLPVKVRSKIAVGSIKVELVSQK